MPKRLNFTLVAIAACFFASCATQPKLISAGSARRMQKVRTTAYTHSERGGRHNALGFSLSGRRVMSAASDWSRFPLGTRFRVVGTNEEYMIDDYGTALVGTGTIDLYKPTRLEMKRWGVRHVDIDILQWGSEERSLKVLAPRAKHKSVRQMIAALAKKKVKPVIATILPRTTL
jgi:3D (Asp-Asp-Asp) domain-containing protein